MAIDQTRGWTGFIVDRVKAILTRPKEAWPEIDRDMTPSGELFTRYAIPLAALAPIGGFIFGRVFGWSPFGFSFFGQLFTAAAGYALSLGSMLVMSIIASKLAPRHGGTGSPRDAFKLIAYSSTAAWLASAAATIPGMGFLGIASLYSLYLYFTGIGPIMKVPEENKGRFGFVTICCAIGLNLAVGILSSGPAMLLGVGPRHEGPPVHINREDVDFNQDQLRDLGREIRDAVRNGQGKIVPAGDLQALLPASVAGFERTRTESEMDGPLGSHAEARYEKGGHEFTLKIVDLAGLARIGTAITINKNKEDENGFERVRMKDGDLTIEKWDKDDDEGKYQTMVGKRFMIEAEGEADSIDQLKSAVASIDQGKLTALKN